ncbi:MAG: hypothetical protein ABSC37_12035 [Xanthobacteraceae bacterium]
MSRRFAPAIVLLAALAPAMAHAQTNIDQGKTPAQIFASDCAVCHKAARGLANGKSSLTLTGFLREHYTASREQAAALAAYVLGAGSDSGTAAQGRGQKPGPEHAGLPVEEPKPGPEHAGAPVEEPKPPTRQARRPAKPEEEAPATAKPQRPMDEEAKPDEPSPVGAPGPASPAPRPAAGRYEPGSAPGARGRQKQPGAVPPAPAPAAVVAAPSPRETSSQDASPTANADPSAAAPTDASPSENSPVPRDDIPD